MLPTFFRDSRAGLTRALAIGHKQERPDYKSYCHNKYALRYAKCALGKCEWLHKSSKPSFFNVIPDGPVRWA